MSSVASGNLEMVAAIVECGADITRELPYTKLIPLTIAEVVDNEEVCQSNQERIQPEDAQLGNCGLAGGEAMDIWTEAPQQKLFSTASRKSRRR